jgi:hypothetical protein
MSGPETPDTQDESVDEFGRLFCTFFAQPVELWLMNRTRQAGPWVNVRIQAAVRHGSDHAAGTIATVTSPFPYEERSDPIERR